MASESNRSVNPYAPTGPVDDRESVSDDEPAVEVIPPILSSLRWIASRWLFVCGIGAIPSFVFGYATTDGEVVAMVLGILIFVAIYTVVDQRTASWPIRQKRTVVRTLRIAYGTRIAISIIFPIGAYLDVICGLFSVGITQSITGVEFRSGSPLQFPMALMTTLIQGVLLNIVLACYAIIVHLLQIAIIALKRRLVPRQGRSNHS